MREAFSELPYGAEPFAMRNPTDNGEQPALTGGNSPPMKLVSHHVAGLAVG